LDKGEQFKEICAHYGAAMYFAQVLEHGIANALVFLDLIPQTRGKWTNEQYDKFLEISFAKTLGNLIRALKAVTSIPSELESSLQEAKNQRSFLAHHFFRERIEDIYQDQYKIIQELEGYRALFESTDKQLQEFVSPIMKRFGFTEEYLERALNEYEQRLSNNF
jgi:hypothetical protein